MLITEIFDKISNKPNSIQTSSDLAATVAYIKTHCQEFLRISLPLKKILYRGVSDSRAFKNAGMRVYPSFISIPRENRKPKGVPISMHKKLIKCFELVGWTATRNKTISCSSNLRNSEHFGGATFAIFPVDGFSCTWSSRYEDIGRAALDGEFHYFWDINIDEITVQMARKFIKYGRWHKDNIATPLRSGKEIALAGKYVAIYAGNLNTHDLLGLFNAN